MPSLQPVRGTHDLLPEEMRRHRRVIDTARAVAERYGYLEMATPIFEFSEVFQRTLGDTSDIVTKEMYSFADRGGEQLTLRPEATAGIARALISNGLSQHLPLKFFCHGPMFRYERPQKGRLRQFHQLDVELLGVPQPQGDVEIVAVGATILRELGVLDRTALRLNTLGDSESRQTYRRVLVDYLVARKSRLSADSFGRLERNPLRILDSKDEGDREVVASAPAYSEYLNAASRRFFQVVTEGLDALGIAYELDSRLVRGLDYYCHTAFEFVTETLGAQGTVLGGGRYDGLVETMGGPPTAGVGWAAGIERLAMMLKDSTADPQPIAMIPVGDVAAALALKLTEQLRRAGFAVDIGFSGNVKKRMARADKIKAVAAVIVGDDELAKGVATVRDLRSGAQEQVALAQLQKRLAAYRP